MTGGGTGVRSPGSSKILLKSLKSVPSGVPPGLCGSVTPAGVGPGLGALGVAVDVLPAGDEGLGPGDEVVPPPGLDPPVEPEGALEPVTPPPEPSSGASAAASLYFSTRETFIRIPFHLELYSASSSPDDSACSIPITVSCGKSVAKTKPNKAPFIYS